MSEEIVLYDDDKAARYVTGIEGWVDRHGRFFGSDEDIARKSGCTHYQCKDCGTPVRKHWTRCRACIEAKDQEKHMARQRALWDWKTPVYSEVLDRYFFDDDELLEVMEDRGRGADELRLLWCSPVYLEEVTSEVWAPRLPDEEHGGDPFDPLPAEVSTALEELNKAIKRAGPVAWEPTETAVSINVEQAA